MSAREDRIRLLEEALENRILVLDGAMGTQLHDRNPTAEDFGGPQYDNSNEHLNLTRPDIVRDIHRAYLLAGADIVETNTFNGTARDLEAFGLEEKTHEIGVAAARLAREAADEVSTPHKPRFVAGSMGPTTRSIHLDSRVRFQELVDDYRGLALALAEGGSDVILLETSLDTRNVKAGLVGVNEAFEQLGYRLPIMVSGTIQDNGTMLAGQAADALAASLEHGGLLSIGLNCATGPEFMTDHLRTIHEMAGSLVSCHPNAGIPDPESGEFPETPDTLAASLERFVRNGWLNIVGGCCGTTPTHIAAIAAMVDGREPRRHRSPRRSYYSGIELVEAAADNRPLLVGERTNEVGSRAFKRMISEEKFEQASEIARRQVRNGAQVIDINLENPDRDELSDIDSFYAHVIHKVKTPFMIDSTSSAAVERALTYCMGKSIINSINFEDGEERFDSVMPLVKRYGAAIVIGSIDEDPEQAQAITRERKLAIAERAHALVTGKWGVPGEDIVFDPLVFPCATGDENYIGSAVETIEALRLIKERMPETKTVLGVSNVSFGLPPAAREVVNSVFLYHATKAGLDLAIVNTEKLERYARIPDEEKRLVEDLLWNAPPEGMDAPRDYREQSPEQRVEINNAHIERVTEHYRAASGRKKEKKSTADLPLDERLANYILEGSKEGLFADLDLKLAEVADPLDIVNGPLMDGMSEVGRLFNANELIVAEVLQSAEAMKAAVAHLEPHMEKQEGASKAKILLATVKGDVHDIGKNLVDIILTNNGYEVVNLGIKVPPEELIKGFREHQPDAIGLSGLLVKSAHQMVTTATDLSQAGVAVPMLVGGAALSDSFTRRKIGPAYGSLTCYAKDAMSGLDLLNRLQDPSERNKLVASLEAEEAPAPAEEAPVNRSTRRSSRASLDCPALPPPYAQRMVRDVGHLQEIWGYINPAMLYTHHLGFRGNFQKKLAERDEKALELQATIEKIKQEAAQFLKLRAVWRFFEAEASGNCLRLFEPGGAEAAAQLSFPRQRREDGLCLPDYVMPSNGRGRDSIALFVVTAGEGVRERAEQYKDDGEYLKMHSVQALALETAEACAEWLHRRIREDWGFPDPPELTMQQRLKNDYRGRRYSPGYAACPDLDDQQKIFELLAPEDIGVRLTDGSMMEPEASVSAMVFHHPDCIYFDVTK